MKTDIKSFWSDITEKLEDGAEIARNACAGIKADIKDLASLGEKKLEKLIDETVDEKTIRQMARAFFNNVEKGRDSAVSALKKAYEECNDKLDKMVETHTEIVGFWDGFVRVFLATPADRKRRSKVYTTHVKYGNVIGITSAIFLFLPAGGIRTIIGVLPIAVRGAKYFKNKIMEARDESAGSQKKGSK